MNLAAIAVGGAIGAVLRFWVSNAVYQMMGRDFPWGTLCVNVVGSAVMGVAFAYLLQREGGAVLMQSALMVGLLGAFTTYSTFSLETLALLQAGEPLKALLNAALSVAGCVVACWGGLILGKALFPVAA